MRTYIAAVVGSLCILALTACGSDKEISLPDAADITEVEIINSTSEKDESITDRDKIAGIIRDITENVKDTGKESVNDRPVNIEDYLTVKFHHKADGGNPTVIYLYKMYKQVSYVEQPYSGIWSLKDEVFDDIRNQIDE